MGMYTYHVDSAISDLLELPTIEKDGQGEAVCLASRIMAADKLSDVEDISSEKILELLPQLGKIFTKISDLGAEQEKDRTQLLKVLPCRRKRKLL